MPKQLLSDVVRVACLTLLIYPCVVQSQEAISVDSEHYMLELENERVRVVRSRYAPGDTSVMHSHPAGLLVFLTDGQASFRFPNGTEQELTWKAGRTEWMPAGTHLPRNTGDKPFELLLIEVKKPADSDSQ